MKTLVGLWIGLVATPAALLAVQVGDSYAKVIAEKGKPAGKIDSGGLQILSYPDVTVKLKEGKVSSVEAVLARPANPAPVVAVKPVPAARTAATETSSGGGGEAAQWGTDYKAALARGKAEDRRVFLFFTGSDWCGWCMRLQKEILTTPEFVRFAAEKLVLVELDFPQKKPQSPAIKNQNRALANQYQIRGYPTVVVLDGTGRKVGELGYQEGGPAPFIAALRAM